MFSNDFLSKSWIEKDSISVGYLLGYLPPRYLPSEYLPLEGTWYLSLQKGPGTRDTYHAPRTDRHLWKHYLPATTDASGKKVLIDSHFKTIYEPDIKMLFLSVSKVPWQKSWRWSQGSLSWKCYFIKYSILGLFSMINIHCISWKLFWAYF